MRKWAAYLLCFLSLALLGISGHFLADYAKQEEKADILQEQLKEIYIPCDLSEYEGKYTVENAKKAIPEIKDRLITEYEKEIERKLNILQHTA